MAGISSRFSNDFMVQGLAATRAASAPFAVLFLPELVEGRVEAASLLLPFAFVYSLSMHVQFYLPVCDAALPTVERVFDRVIDGHSLKSKGVTYLGTRSDEIAAIMKDATLLITTESGVSQYSGLDSMPRATLCHTDGAQIVRLGNVGRLASQELKGTLVTCAQLINIQSAGFINELWRL